MNLRQTFYDDSGLLKISKVKAVKPSVHTMGKENFRKYIGRHDQKATGLDQKKFSHEQGAMISRAFFEGMSINVIGAYKDDFEFLLSRNNAVLNGRIEDYKKPKLFNCERQRMFFVEREDNARKIELWVLVFPSKQYVDQVAELLKAIIDDFSETQLAQSPGVCVNVAHFPRLESSIPEWTGFTDFVSLYLRHGDVVVIGNIELLIQGIKDFSFSIPEHSYDFGGLNNMFGVCVALNDHTQVRMILVGIKESFWGDASAQFVESILKVGATHILYGSKAATTITNQDIHSTYAPEHFSLVNENGSYINIEYQRGGIGKFIENLGVQTTGFAITVPTVIGESHEQRESIRNVGPTCMDCENGHIALRVSKLNQYYTNDASRLTDSSFQRKFIPVHFITDYIYNSKEAIDDSLGHLSVHGTEANESTRSYLKKRNESFRKIGNVFAVYALTFGRKNVGVPVTKVSTHKNDNEPNFEAEYYRIQPLLDSGLGLEAISQIASERDGDEYRIYPAMIHAMICQKEGYVLDSTNTINSLLKSPSVSLLSSEEQLRLKVILLKNFSQVGSQIRILNLLENMKSSDIQNQLSTIRQFGAVKRREMIFESLNGNFRTVLSLIDQAKDVDSDSDLHYIHTNLLFELIARLPHKAAHGNLEEISNKLSTIRRAYLSVPSTGRWWQTNFEKCALSALFLEASYYLSAGVPSLLRKGATALTLAHLFNRRQGGNEKSETYGEIINCISDYRVKNLVVLAMRSDSESQKQFQRWVNKNFNLLHSITSSFQSMSRDSVTQREDLILGVLSK